MPGWVFPQSIKCRCQVFSGDLLETVTEGFLPRCLLFGYCLIENVQPAAIPLVLTLALNTEMVKYGLCLFLKDFQVIFLL